MKGKYTFISMLLLITLTQFSCVKEFIPSLSKYEDLLVVDGEVTNLPGPYTIKLSRSNAVEQKSKYIPYGGCNVKITDNNGNVAVLKETTEGEYKTDSASFRGETGKQYKITIQTPDNEEYESAFEELKAPVKIKNLYAALEHKNVNAEEMSEKKQKYGRDGYQFYVDTEPTTTADNFLYWKLSCTYKFSLDVDIYYYYDWSGLHKVYQHDTFRTCYRDQNIPDFYLATAITNQKELTHFPLNYEDNYSRALTTRYSIKALQYTINKEAYIYFSEIKKMRDMGGDLYATQPYQLKSNVVNTKKTDKIVLGYFMVAGVDEKRIFVNSPPITFRHGLCEYFAEMCETRMSYSSFPEYFPIFLQSNLCKWDPPECIDCRHTGYLQKPPFWID